MSMTKQEYQKQYWQANKQRLTALQCRKYTCQLCSGQYTFVHRQSHYRTKKHQSAIVCWSEVFKVPPSVLHLLIMRSNPSQILSNISNIIVQNDHGKEAQEPSP